MVAAFALALLGHSLSPLRDPTDLALLCALGIIGESIPESKVLDSAALSFLGIVTLAAAALIGPAGAAIVAGASTLLPIARLPLSARLFNASMSALLGSLCGLTYVLTDGAALGRTAVGSPSGLLLHVGIPMVAANIVQVVMNAVLLSGVIRLTAPIPIRENVTRLLESSGAALAGHGVLAFLLVVLLRPGALGPVAALLIVAPLLGAQWAFSQLANERHTRQGAIDALAQVVEVSAGADRGQTQRVATIGALIARNATLSHQQVDALVNAARLHNLGMIGEPAALLIRSEPLDEVAMSALSAHPARSVRMIRQIDFLSDTFAAIRHHHERYDGSGYPDGLAGEDIPVLARVLAVADAFDALSEPGPGRSPLSSADALEELAGRAGAQLDGRFVEALRRGLLDAEEAAKIEAAHEDDPMPGINHDDPSVSDLLARTDFGAATRLPAAGRYAADM